MLWNYDVSDKEEAERMASLYGEDFTRAVESGMEVETGRNLVRRCGNELGVATWEAYDFDPDTWTCETFSNREAAELWLSGSLYLDECNELDDQLTQSVKRMATLVANMSGGRWTAGIQEYRDGRKSLSFQLSDETGFFLITSPICKASELALGVVRDRVREELADLDPYREALEACRRAEDSSIALDKLAFYEKLKDRDMPVLLGALAVATEQNQRAIGRLLADRKFEDMPNCRMPSIPWRPPSPRPRGSSWSGRRAATATACIITTPPHPTSLTTTTWPTRSAVPSWKVSTR